MDGRIEMRWDKGVGEWQHSIAVGLEDEDLAVPATGDPFGAGGVAPEYTWPRYQCRMLTPTANGGYTEDVEIFEPPPFLY